VHAAAAHADVTMISCAPAPARTPDPALVLATADLSRKCNVTSGKDIR
jgi:hypothetical protein